MKRAEYRLGFSVLFSLPPLTNNYFAQIVSVPIRYRIATEGNSDGNNANGLNKEYQWLSNAWAAVQQRMMTIGADKGEFKFNVIVVTVTST